MNCADTGDICTKVKEMADSSNVTVTPPRPSFAIKFGSIALQEDTIDINYFIIKNGNFSVENFTCGIASAYHSQNAFQEVPLDCDLNIEGGQFINIAVSEGSGMYNVCISIFHHGDIYSVECANVEYNPPTEEVTDSSSTLSTTVGDTTISTSILKTTTVTSTTRDQRTTSTTSKSNLLSSTTINYTSVSTTINDTSVNTTTFKTPTVSSTTHSEPTDPTTTKPNISSPVNTSSTLTETPSETTTWQYTETPTMMLTTLVTKSPHKKPSVKSFSIDKDAKSNLWLSWNMSAEDHGICTLEFSVLLHDQPHRSWQMECRNGTYFLGNIKSNHPYQICIEMYLNYKLVETNCTEISPSLVPLSAGSKSSGLSRKLPLAAFVILIILAVIILILIIVMIIKIVHLRKNKANAYYVAKEHNNQTQVSKRSSHLYSVSSLEDDDKL